MATFIQSGQVVGQQNNADVINVNSVGSKSDLLAQLDTLRCRVNEAAQAGQLDSGKQKIVDEHIADAMREARKPEPDKSTITNKLEMATNAVKGIVAVAGLYEALKKVVELAHKFF